MVLHELSTNAMKYGALSALDGTLTVTWRLTADGQLRIDWQEAGGPLVVVPRQKGFGARLLKRGIEQELGGKAHLAFDPAGVHCTIEIPMPA